MNIVEQVARAIQNSAAFDGNDSPVDRGDAEALARAALAPVLSFLRHESGGHDALSQAADAIEASIT